MLTYTTRLLSDSQEDLKDLRKLLEYERDAFNIASVEQHPEKNRSIIVLHGKVYSKIRKERPEIPAQVVIRGEQACLSAYRTIKSNKHKISKPVEKKRLSIRLDKRLYAPDAKGFIRITTANGRKRFRMVLYPKLEALLDSFKYKDPQVFERDGVLYIAMTFGVAVEPAKQKNGFRRRPWLPSQCGNKRWKIDCGQEVCERKAKIAILETSVAVQRDQGRASSLEKVTS